MPSPVERDVLPWVVFLVGGRLVMAGDMPIDRFFTFAMYVYELTFPTFIMGWVFALWQRGGAAMQHIEEMLRYDSPTQALPASEQTCSGRQCAPCWSGTSGMHLPLPTVVP